MTRTRQPTKNGRSKSANGKLGHDPIQVPIDSLWPAPENDALYRPVDPTDPAIKALALRIRKHGVREPLVITLDGYILSGGCDLLSPNVYGVFFCFWFWKCLRVEGSAFA
jgi:hypothetical protein